MHVAQSLPRLRSRSGLVLFLVRPSFVQFSFQHVADSSRLSVLWAGGVQSHSCFCCVQHRGGGQLRVLLGLSVRDGPGPGPARGAASISAALVAVPFEGWKVMGELSH